MEQKLTLMRYDRKDREKLLSRFIALDFETTGLSATENKIIEIGAVLFEKGKATKEYSTLVHPGEKIPDIITAITGLRDEDFQNAPKEKEVLPDFLSFLGDARTGETFLCAHNARFDGSFLKEWLRRENLSFHLKFYDTLRLSRERLDLCHYRLSNVSEYYGIRNQHAHRASSDAWTCGEVLLKLLEENRQD